MGSSEGKWMEWDEWSKLREKRWVDWIPEELLSPSLARGMI